MGGHGEPMKRSHGSMAAGYAVGPPVAALCQPGECFFGEDWVAVPLVSKATVSHDTKVFTFGLPNVDQPLGLSTCACILARGGADTEGNPVVRPYTPVSTNAMLGKFELMVKIYPEGIMGNHMDKMAIGDTLEFKHISFNVKIQAPFGKRHIGMLVGGTGITPMVQALHAVLGAEGDATKVSMLVGNRTTADMLAKETLDAWSVSHPERLDVTHVLSNEADASDWQGERGYIGAELIKSKLPAPADDVMIFVCGPPPMYDALCGARGEKDVTGVLKELGYTADMVIKF